MSGLEALGVAASIIQVADLGTKLSVKLFSFYRQVKNADETLQLLSNEVALISAILRELGDNLKADESAKLCSDEAFRTLELVLDQCRDVLRQIERVVGINDHSAKTRFQQVTGKFRLVLLEPSLDPLKTNLERLKSTMLLLLNVIMFAGQVRKHNMPVLQEQRALIEALLQEKKEDGGEPILPKHNQSQQRSDFEMIQNHSKTNAYPINESGEVEEYNALIRKMLREIDFCKSKLENSRYSRIRNGVLGIHDSEIVRFQLTYGHSVLHHFDKSLRQYIPGPAASGIQQSGQPHPMNIPPPPRHPVPPPPPMRTPGEAAYGDRTQFQSRWIPPPPPPMTPVHSQSQHMDYGRPSTAPVSIPPPPPLPPPPQTNNANNTQPDNLPLTSATYIPRNDQPLTSATYIPGHGTIGVGIRPSIEARTPYEAYSHNQPRLNQVRGISSVDDAYTRDDSALYENVHYDKAQRSGASRPPDVGKSHSNRHKGTGDLSPSEAPDHWPLDRVLLWLAANGFSDDWQETFKALELQGGEFLELGLGSGGRGNFSKMHQVVYPQLAKECARRGSKYDQGHEREEGKRMRKLIRQIHDGSEEASVSTPERTDLPLFSAEALPGFYSNAEPRSTGGGNDMYPDPSAALQAPSSTQWTNGQMRSVKGPPTSAGHDTLAHDFPSRELVIGFRSEESRNALSSLSYHRRKSPLVSSDTGPYPAPSSYRQNRDSPKSGSPAMQQVSPSYPELSSSSTPDLTIRREHSQGSSTDSIPRVGHGHGSSGRYYASCRQGQDGTCPSPQDRQCSSEILSSLPREHNKGIFNFLRRKAKADSSYPPPEDPFLESPTSPEAHHDGPYPPYPKPFLNSSDLDLCERPSSTHTSNHEKFGRTKHTSKGKRWISVTMDGWNYRLIDVSEMETAESLRTGICQYLGISDWGNAQIYLTMPGQSKHEDPLNDINLSFYRTNTSDPYGSLKLFLRGTVAQPAQGTPRLDGLSVSVSEKPASSTTTLHQLHRKPLDEDALNRISPHTQLKPLGSPSQPTFKNSPVANGSQGRTTDTEKDTRARYEDNLREAELKQKAYRGSQLHPSQQTPKDASGEMVDLLVPPRRGSTAPNESSALTKVNFPKGIASREARPQLRISTHGLGTGLTSIGRMTSAIGTPPPSVPVSSSTPSWASASSGSERPATMDSVASASNQSALHPLRPSPKLTTDQEAQKSQESFCAPSPAVTHSSIASQEPPLQSFGSKFKFEEHEISFQRSFNPVEGSNHSSIDGLWTNQLPHMAKQAEASPQKTKPIFPIDTGNKRKSEVRFSIKKLGDGRDDCDHEAEEHSHTDSPSTMETNIALPVNFEELLLRWTKLGWNEVQAL